MGGQQLSVELWGERERRPLVSLHAGIDGEHQCHKFAPRLDLARPSLCPSTPHVRVHCAQKSAPPMIDACHRRRLMHKITAPSKIDGRRERGQRQFLNMARINSWRAAAPLLRFENFQGRQARMCDNPQRQTPCGHLLLESVVVAAEQGASRVIIANVKQPVLVFEKITWHNQVSVEIKRRQIKITLMPHMQL